MSGYILIADGDGERGKSVAEACASRGLASTLTTHGAAALEAALADGPAAIVCQLELPLIDGPRLAAILDANPRTHGIGLLFVADRQGEGRDAEVPGRIFEPPLDPDQVASCAQALAVHAGPRRERLEPEGGGVDGEIGQLPLADLLELFHVSRKTGVVELARRGQGRREVGRIALRGGDVIHAASGETQGVKAFFRLLGWERGSFSFRPASNPQLPVTIETPTRALLREGQRQLQEWQRVGVEMPRMDDHVRLRIERSALPNVIHPLTQEVLLVLELHSRVSDVVEQCSYPDYQVLRTLATLVGRGIVELHHEPATSSDSERQGLYSPAQVARLREWRGGARGAEAQDAKLLVVSSSLAATRELARRLQELPGVELDARAAAGAFEEEDLLVLGRVAVDDDLGIQLVHLPVGPELAPFWATAGYGALGSLLLLADPVGAAVARVAPVAAALGRLPRSRLFHLLLVKAGERVDPESIRRNLSLLEDGSLFLVPLEHPPNARTMLREVFARVLP